MQRKGHAYYYVANRQWVPLGSDLPRALRLWADIEGHSNNLTVSQLVERWLADCTDGYSEGTKKTYRTAARRIDRQWGKLPIDMLKPPVLARYRDSKAVSGVSFNIMLSVLRNAYAKAVEWGLHDSNPAQQVAQGEQSHKRERYLTDSEFVAVRAAAPKWLALMMDLAYATGLRPVDVVNLKWSNVVDEHLVVLPRKTQKTEVGMRYPLTAELAALLEQARQRPVVGLYIVATDRGVRITATRYRSAWRAAAQAAGVSGAEFRDIRSKSGTDADTAGQDAQKLLHHTNARMTRRYMKKLITVEVEPLRKKL